ncbi:MAG TPA: hypothetical protein VMF06_07640 [Candidatus Limnocylindria bacterium]|jgi:hypothetical protein|nr:hypothetical protein [Candidatus Limnocylindria bacterium]
MSFQNVIHNDLMLLLFAAFASGALFSLGVLTMVAEYKKAAARRSASGRPESNPEESSRSSSTERK